MKKLIVNADDFGVTQSVNRGIIYGFQRGIITSTSLMVKRLAVKEAAKLAKENPGIEIGLHFDIEYNFSYDKRNKFLDNLENNKSESIRNFLKKELLEQLKEFKKLLGKLPGHIDGHHHIHKFPAILPFILEFSKENKTPLRDLSGITRIKTFSTGNSKDVTKENLTKILQNLPDGIFELMVHPGYTSDELRKISSWADIREKELEILTSPEIRKVIKEEKIQLVSWASVSMI